MVALTDSSPYGSPATPYLIPGMPVWGNAGAIGTFAGARLAATGDSGAFVLIRLTHLFGLRSSTHVVPASWVIPQQALTDVSPLRLDANRAQVVRCPRVRADAHIRSDVARALRDAGLTRGGASVHASVFNGVVEITGHTPGEGGILRAAECALRVPGVIAVAVVDRITTGQELAS